MKMKKKNIMKMNSYTHKTTQYRTVFLERAENNTEEEELNKNNNVQKKILRNHK